MCVYGSMNCRHEYFEPSRSVPPSLPPLPVAGSTSINEMPSSSFARFTTWGEEAAKAG